jgi:hypothetical protein
VGVWNRVKEKVEEELEQLAQKACSYPREAVLLRLPVADIAQA